MTRRSDLRDAATVARTELAAMWRRLTDSRRRMLGVGLGVLQFAVVLPAVFFQPVLAFGRDLASATPPVGTVGALYFGAAVSGVYLGSMAAIGQNRIGSVGPLIRTSVPPAAVSAGRIASETVQGTVVFALLAVAALVEVGIGAGSPLAPLLFGIGLFLFVLAGLFLGRTVGATARYAGVLARLSAWGKAAAFLLVMGAVFLGSQVAIQAVLPDDADFGFAVSVPAFLPGEPVQAVASLLLSPLGAAARPLGLPALVVTVASVPAFLALAVRAETALLLTDAGDGAEETVSRTVPRPFTATPGTRVAFRHLLRTARDPKSAFHLLPVLFGGLGAGVTWFSQPDLAFAMAPPAMVVLGAETAGLLYCLNPLGDDRDQLPLLMTSVQSTAVLLRGRVLGGVAVGAVFALGLGTPLAVLGHPPAYVVLQTALAVVLLVAVPAAALGLGAFAPKFERPENLNVERAQPSQRATFGFLFGGTLLAGGGMFLAWWTVSGDSGLPLLVGGWVGYLAVVGGLGIGGYRYAVQTFDAFTLDDV